jgi:hypothetical protein
VKPTRRPLVAVSATLVLVILQAVIDPTGLLALVGWSGAVPDAAAGIWPFARYLVFLPVLLGIVWWTAARAGERYWTLVVGVVLAVLLAQAASCLVMTGNPAVAAHAAAYVTAKAVPAALVVAALTRWLGGRSERGIRTQPGLWPPLAAGSSWVPALLLAAASPFVAGLWWTGAVYAPAVPVARLDRGPIAMVVAMVLIAVATAASVHWMRARVSGVLGGWIAAVVAGGMVGVVQALVAFVVDGGLAGDLWPLMALYVAVADGLSFGACLGWLVGIAAVLVDRVERPSAVRIVRLSTAGAAVVALVAGIAVSIVPVARAAADDIPSGYLRADGRVITDGDGAEVILRGVNVNQLVDFYRPRPDVDDTRPLSEEDFAGIAAQGFNVVRLNISWSALEPERGTLDDGYLARIHEAVDWASERGIYTVLDMHQDSWWAGATPEGTSCRPGTDPMWGYDGAPEWATVTDGAPRCQFQSRDISAASNRAFENFYFDTRGVQSALVTTWGRLAAEFADDPWIAGFDLLNEPGFGETAPVSTSYQLGRFYGRAIDAIREAGAPQIVFVEPSIFWSGLGFDAGPSLGFTDDRNIVFSPHLYAESLTLDRDLGIPPIVGMPRQFALAQRVADAYGAPVWSGEYGYWGDEAGVVSRLTRYAELEDAYRYGGAYWVWKQACGDPQNGIGETGNGLMVQDCATGGDAPPRDDLLELLSRAYPRSAPGVLTSLRAEGAHLELTGQADAQNCGLEVWVPGAREPRVDADGVTRIAIERVDGGWLVTGCADGSYAMRTE